MNSKKRTLSVAIISAATVVACVVMLLCYFLFKPNPSIDRLIDDMVIYEKEIVDIEFDKNIKDVKFSSVNEQIAKVIDNSKVQGISFGVTFLKATFEIDGKQVSQTSQISVLKKQEPEVENYFLDLCDLNNCTFSNNTLTLLGSASANIKIYSDESKTEEVSFEGCSVVCSDGIECQIELQTYLYIDASKNGNIVLKFSKPEVQFTITVQI